MIINFYVKTNRELVRQRLEIDKNIEIYKNSWPLRLPYLNDGVDIIVGFSEIVAEKAQKRGFRVIEIPRDTDGAYIAEAEGIKKEIISEMEIITDNTQRV